MYTTHSEGSCQYKLACELEGVCNILLYEPALREELMAAGKVDGAVMSFKTHKYNHNIAANVMIQLERQQRLVNSSLCIYIYPVQKVM